VDAGVGWVLVHWVQVIVSGLVVLRERFLFLWLVGFGFQRLVLLSVHPAGAGGPFDQSDLMEEELEAAQSMASNKDVTFFQVRQRARLTFQSGGE
jgi:hypothetical protein